MLGSLVTIAAGDLKDVRVRPSLDLGYEPAVRKGNGGHEGQRTSKRVSRDGQVARAIVASRGGRAGAAGGYARANPADLTARHPRRT